MDENAHKALLDHRRKPRRWIKTNPAGWFSCPLEQLSDSIILVEGAFDRLTLLAAGFASTAVVALTGTAAQVDWFPPQVKTIVLAFDGDEGGKEATSRLADQLRCEGFNVRVCPPPCDKWGKDWNERWRKIGQESMLPLQEMYSELSLA
jgi:DNA primase